MTTRTIGLFIVSSILTVVCAEPSIAAGEWLAGNWSGYIEGLGQGEEVRDIGARVLVFNPPAADGSVSGGMAIVGTPWGQVTGKLMGESVSLDVNSGSHLELKRNGDRLTGTWVFKGGQSKPIALARPHRAPTLDGAWKGEATTAKSDKCWPGVYEVAIKDGVISGSVHFIQLTGAGRDRRTWNHDSDVTGEVWPDGNIFFALAGKGEQTRTTFFHAKLDGGVIKALDPGGGMCVYRVELSKH